MKRREARGGPGRGDGHAGVSADSDRLVVAVFGPTASGKTAVSQSLARHLGSEVVSADSMQVYRGLPILTDQPAMPTQLVGIWPLEHEASVAEYAVLAHAAVDRSVREQGIAVVAGGTGLYLRAALTELHLPPAPALGVREHWADVYDRLGREVAHALLAERDPAAALAVHPNDRRRVLRALELTDAGASLRPSHDRLWSRETRHPTLVVGLEVMPDLLERRIESRTREMFARGVVREVTEALAGPLSSTARQVIGLREVAELSEETAMEAIVVRTRRYAAYQRKWLRRVPGLVRVASDRHPDEVADEILEVARTRKRLPGGGAG